MSNNYDEMKKEILKKDMLYVVNYLNTNIDNIISIYLCGGYGRGEGAWVLDYNRKIRTFNDYDLTIILPSRIDNDIVEKARTHLAKELCIEWVDINIMTKRECSHLHTSIKNIDLLYGSKLIYGKELLVDNKQLDKTKIGLNDIELLYFTRMWCFFGSFKGQFKELNGYESLFFKNQMGKAILSTVDVILIQHHLYETSYVKRVEIVKKIISDEKYISLVNWGLEQKLSPSLESISQSEMKKVYNDCMLYYKKIFEKAFGFRKKMISNPYLTKIYFLTRFKHLSRLLFNNYIRKSSQYRRYLEINCLQNYMFSIIYENGKNVKKISIVNRMISKLDASINISVKWSEMKNTVANIRNGE